ncbi:MAG TPA: glycine/betaine/sarcosine/D-proline family reductase selenoprotein B [Syntrophorhabdales bacterium]|nr:glycine/betaine/sarcosine/D-proline family reductase selenoprotein B [Syntrophorhabdales bacterium]
MSGKTLRVVHYINQFFGQQGGEEKAGIQFLVKDGAVGSAVALQKILGERAEIVATLICGDNYFAENTDKASEEGTRLAAQYKPDLFFAGPAFGAGRYGLACGALCKAVESHLRIPAVTAMSDENPGVDLYSRDTYIVRTERTTLKMAESLNTMVKLAFKLLSKDVTSKLVSQEALGRPSEDGYFPRGVVRNEFVEKTAAERGVDMLLARLRGEEVQSEVPSPDDRNPVPAPAMKKPLHLCEIALVSDGGLVPKDNPHGLRGRGNTVWAAYEIDKFFPQHFSSDDYAVAHTGYFSLHVLQNPNRLIPFDAMRELAQKGVVKLHPFFYSTSGNATAQKTCREMGLDIARSLKEKGGVDGVILTST